MRLLDTFCKAGGCSRGYDLAGFDEIVGVDIEAQPNYPYEFIQADALEYLRTADLSGFDAIHASPPCQFASSATRVSGNPGEHPNLIPPTRDLLIVIGLPYVIENVEGAREHLIDPVKLCGSMFDPPLDVQRHRYFETNWGLKHPDWPCRHNLWDFRFRSLDQRRRKGLNQRSVPRICDPNSSVVPEPFTRGAACGITLRMTGRSGSGLIALRLSPDLDARLRAAAPQNMSDYVRDAIEQKLSQEAPPGQPEGARGSVSGRTGPPSGKRRSAGGRCAHRQPSGAYCAKCDSVVP